MYFLCFALLGSIIVFYVMWTRTRKGREIPGPRGLPVLGCLFELTPENMIQKCFTYAKKYGDIMKITICGQHLVFLNSYEMINTAFCGEKYKQYLNDRPKTFLGETYAFGKGIFTEKDGSIGSLHTQLKHAAHRGFHLFVDNSDKMEKTVRNEISNVMEIITCHDTKREFDVVQAVERSTSNMLSVLFVGAPLEDINDDSDIIVEFNNLNGLLLSPKSNFVLTNFPFIRYLPGWYKNTCMRYEDIRARLLDIFYTQIKKSFKPGTIRGFVDFMIAEQRQQVAKEEEVMFTDDTIKSIILEFCVLGFTTTRTALSSILLCLICHPEYQAKIHKEIDDVIGERLPTLQDKAKCPMIEAVIMEAIRLDYMAASTAPHITEKHLEFEGFDLPKNSQVFGNLWFICHNKKIWGDPWTFRPERFLDQFGQLVLTSNEFRKNWLVFGAGKRQCFGGNFALSRIFLYTTTLLQRWKLIPLPDKCYSCDPRTDQFVSNILVYLRPFSCHVEQRS